MRGEAIKEQMASLDRRWTRIACMSRINDACTYLQLAMVLDKHCAEALRVLHFDGEVMAKCLEGARGKHGISLNLCNQTMSSLARCRSKCRGKRPHAHHNGTLSRGAHAFTNAAKRNGAAQASRCFCPKLKTCTAKVEVQDDLVVKRGGQKRSLLRRRSHAHGGWSRHHAKFFFCRRRRRLFLHARRPSQSHASLSQHVL
mmetsp:Transcript_21442/g.57373  ORF Transcript_21442/g.57373 Transcript_21442/m.57373 type:complete len:200 (-) Transcript_21442:797-1396(-)